MEKFMGWLKKLFNEGEGAPKKDNARHFKMLLAAAVVGVGLMVLGNFGSNKSAGTATGTDKQAQPAKETPTNQSSQLPGMVTEEKYLADKLCFMLKQVKGAGNVEVSVQLDNSTQSDYAVNKNAEKKTTVEKDQSGGTRNETDNTNNDQIVMVKGNNGSEKPVVQQETAPKISGVLVIADGASDPEVKARLFTAVEVGMGVEPQKILVLPRGK